MKSKRVVVFLVLSLLAGAGRAEELTFTGRPRIEKPHKAVLNRGGMRSPAQRIRICSYNLENFTDGHGDGRKRTRSLAERQAQKAAGFLFEIDPDIVVLQEIENAQALKLLNRYVKPSYPVGYITGFNSSGGHREKLNIAVLSRFPLRGLREIDFGSLEGPGRPPRGALSFYVDLGSRRHLLVYGVHLKSNWGERPRNIARRRNALKILRDDADDIRIRYPAYAWEVLVAGDMNTDPEADSFRTDRSLEPLADWIDLWRGQPLAERITLPTRYGDPSHEFPPVTFDRFIASRDMGALPWVAKTPRVLSKGVNTRDAYAPPGSTFHVSDHYPVYVDLWEQPPSSSTTSPRLR